MIKRSLDAINESFDSNNNVVVSNTNPSILLDDTSALVGIKINQDNGVFNIASDAVTDETYTSYLMRYIIASKAMSIGMDGANAAYGLQLHQGFQSTSGNTTQAGILGQYSPNSAATTYIGAWFSPSTVDGCNITNYNGVKVAVPSTIGTGVVAQYDAIFVPDNSSFLGSTRTSAYYSTMAAGLNKYGLHIAGTANNLLSGDTVISANLFQKATTVALATSTPVTLTIANLLTPLVTTAPTANQTLNLPTGALIEANFTNVAFLANTGIEWNLINTSTFTSTIAASTGHTIVGNAVVAANTSARFITRKTATDTYVTYRV